MRYTLFMGTIGDQLKAAIDNSGMTKYAIAKASGVKQPTLHKFMVAGAGLRLESIEQLCDYFGLELARKQGMSKTGTARKTTKRKGTK